MRRLLVVTALLEGATGLALVALPSRLVALLLGSSLDAPAAVTVARVAGVALIALALTCWLARADAQGGAARGLVGRWRSTTRAWLACSPTGVSGSGCPVWVYGPRHCFTLP